MLRIAELVEQAVLASPLLEDALATGIVNLSALARRLKPSIEKALMKEVSDAAVMMALKRLTPKLARRMRAERRSIKRLGDLTVRSELVELTFRISDTIWAKYKRLLQRIEGSPGTFVTYTQGVFEVMLIVSAQIEAKVLEIFHGERLASRVRELSAIVIRLAPSTVETPGVYYAILKRLAWMNVNVVDVVSTYTEFTIVVPTHDVDRAFSVLHRYLWP